jgi:predicted metalloprotease with PDZ domain
MRDQEPLNVQPSIPAPRDVPYCGRIRLHVDATDVDRCIFQIRETIPVPGPGVMTLLYPKWLPGFHSPAAAIELFAGLEIFAGDLRLAWRRDPVEVHAFHVEVPPGRPEIEAKFQFLAPTAQSQGPIAVTPAISAVRWSAMVLYPAGHYARQIEIQPSLTLPDGWTAASSLRLEAADQGVFDYAATPLDDLVDAPVLAGRWTRRVSLDGDGAINLALVADRAELLAASAEQIAPHQRLVAEADALFGARPFERYEFLVAVSEELGGGGVEHHQSCEIVAPPTYFTAWEANASSRDVFAHEFVHAWNGKARRGSDSWTASFEQPIRNSLMWVYEGLTQYWGEVLAARSGLWTPQQARDTLARTAALYENRPGGAWRPMSATTRDPIIASRQPLPWPSWQRSEDYYSEGQLLWLDVDTLIRKLSEDSRSLDDFAKAFFGGVDGHKATSTYAFEELTRGLEALAPHDWAAFLTERLESRAVGAPLEGLDRGGYQLVYRKAPSDFAAQTDAAANLVNLRFSIGLTVSNDGTLQEVIWDGPAFKAGAVAGATVRAVNGRTFTPQLLQQAIEDAETRGAIELVLERGKRVKTIEVQYSGGLRFPHLAPIDGARRRLDEIYEPRARSSKVSG